MTMESLPLRNFLASDNDIPPMAGTQNGRYRIEPESWVWQIGRIADTPSRWKASVGAKRPATLDIR